MRSPAEAVRAAFAAIEADGRDAIWLALVDRSDALAAAAEVERRLEAGEDLPLAGRTLAVKDNIDVAGLPTTAACPAYAYQPAVSAPAVVALVAAGVVVIGKTNLDQFATGLVGTRSPHGACPNAHWPGLVSGGSSSGSAVAVAGGMVDLALGTDTAGSGRVPAAANGIVGVKPTKGWISTGGVVPACRSLDCVSVFARTVTEAAEAASIAAATPVGLEDPYRRVPPADLPGLGPDGAADRGITSAESNRSAEGAAVESGGNRPRRTTAAVPAVDGRALRVGIPSADGLTFDGDPDGPARFAAALGELLATAPGAERVEVDLVPFSAAAALLYGGAFVAERYEAVGAFVEEHPADVDPVVGPIIVAAGTHPAWALASDQAELRRLALVTAPVWDAIDVLVVPSVPRIPTIAEVDADPIGVNSMLGTYTNFVNLLDLAAVTIPVPSADPDPSVPPPSLTLIAPAWSDAKLAELAARLA